MKPSHPTSRLGLIAAGAAVALLAACAQRLPQAPVAAAASAASAPTEPLAASGARAYPYAAPKPVTHTYHGVDVTTDFEWLENAGDPATKSWVAAENAYSRNYLDAMPARDGVHQRLQALMSSTSNAYSELVERGGLVFALKSAPPKQQPLLVTLKSVDDLASEHVVFDPNVAAADGSLTIDFFRPSPDGKRVALSVSLNGSEDGTLRFIDVATGQETGERLPRVAYPTAGGDVAWSAGGAGVYYTRYPDPGSRPDADLHFYQHVFFHRLGTPVEQDTFEVGDDFPRIGETQLRSSRDGRVVTALVQNGDGDDYALWLKTPNGAGEGAWRRIAAESDGIKDVRIADDGALVLRSLAGAPHGKLLRLPVSARTHDVNWAKVPVVVPASDGTIDDYLVSGRTVWVVDQLGGPSRLRAVDVGSRRSRTIALPPVTGVEGLADLGHNDVVARNTSYLAPPAWFHVAGKRGVQRSALTVTSDASFNDCEVVREFATSKDGTKVPLNIIRRKGTPLDGRNPVILYGYGGFGISETPGFSSARRVWLDRGGIYVDANLRGGGEYGQEWHQAGSLTHKQNVFDDFAAAAQYLIQHGYTDPKRLGILGGSNGGLLMGATLTQHPELFRAVVSAVGYYDMLRFELDPNGAFNTSEYGSVQDEAQFQALRAYSPLHNVRDGAAYPAILMMTGDNDGRVNPAHSRKMIARLQQADPSGRPILLRTSASSGHGIGTALAERIEEQTDLFAFFANELSGAD